SVCREIGRWADRILALWLPADDRVFEPLDSLPLANPLPGRSQCAAPAGHQAAGRVFGRDGVANVVPPGAVDVQAATPHTFLVEAELLYDASARPVFRPDRGLDPVQADDRKAMVEGQREGRGSYPEPGELLVDP